MWRRWTRGWRRPERGADKTRRFKVPSGCRKNLNEIPTRLGEGAYMSKIPEDTIEIFIGHLLDAKHKGVEAINIDTLIAYAKEMDKHAVYAGETSDLHLHTTLSEYNHSLDTRREGYIESFRATIEHGNAAIKSAILINGAAVIALLSFSAAFVSSHPELSSSISGSIIRFAVAVFFAAIATGSTYLSQAFFTGTHNASEHRQVYLSTLGYAFQVVSVTCWVLSIGLFLSGALETSKIIGDYSL